MHISVASSSSSLGHSLTHTHTLKHTSLLVAAWTSLASINTVVEKKTIDMTSYPLSLTASVLACTSVCNFLIWALRARKVPRWNRIRVRHLPRLLGSAALHAGFTGLGAVSLSLGTASAAIVFRTLQAFTASRNSTSNKTSSHPGVASMSLAAVSVLLGVLVSIDSIPQALAAMVGGLCLTVRGTIPFDPARFRGPQNIFAIVTALSFLVLFPVALLAEGTQGMWMFLTPELRWRVWLLGITSFLANEATFEVFQRCNARERAIVDTSRRVLSFLLAAVFCGEMVVVEGALLAFGGFYYSTALAGSSALHAVSTQRFRTYSDTSVMGSVRSLRVQ